VAVTSSRLGITLRLVGVGACMLIEIEPASRILAGSPEAALRGAGLVDLGLWAPLPAVGAAWLSVGLALLLFGGLYWWTALGIDRRTVLWVAFIQLAVLTALASLLSLGGVFLVALLAAVVLPPRPALAWLGAQIAGVAAFAVSVRLLGVGVPVVEGPAMPAPVTVTVDAVTLAVWQVFAFAIGFVAVEETRQRGELARVNAELLATRQLLAEGSRVAERARVQGALEERFGESLSDLAAVLDRMAPPVGEKALATLSQTRDLARSLRDELGQVARQLGPLGPLDLQRALRTLAAGVTTPRVHLDLSPRLQLSNPELAHTLFRCAQEAVTNAVKHSGASNLWLEIADGAGTVTLAVRDDGRGAGAVVAGHGLAGMRERVEALAGRLDVASTRGRGFSLRIDVPCAASAR
jgi:signal transduction histidine kinase